MAPVALHLLPSIRAGSSPTFTHALCSRVCTAAVENVEYDWPDADTVAVAPAEAVVCVAPSVTTPGVWVVAADPADATTKDVEGAGCGTGTSAADTTTE